MKPKVRLTIGIISLALFLLTSVFIQFLSLQNHSSSSSVSNKLASKLTALIFGDDIRESESEIIEAEGISVYLNNAKSTFEQGTTGELMVTLTPANATTAIEYFSSDESIASIDSSGKITFSQLGTCTIYAKAGDIKSNELTITVIEKASSLIGLDFSLFNIFSIDHSPLDALKVNSCTEIDYTYNGKDYTLDGASFESSDNSVINVYALGTKYFYARAKKPGTATINLVCENQIICSKQVTVTNDELSLCNVTSMSLNGQVVSEEATLILGEVYTASFTFDSENPANSLILRQLDTTITEIGATYANNSSQIKINATKVGSDTFTFSRIFDNELLYSIKLNIIPPEPTVLGIEISNNLVTDVSYQVSIKTSNKYASQGWIVTTSSDNALYNETTGKIKFLTVGKHTITFTSKYYPDQVYTYEVAVTSPSYTPNLRKYVGHFGLFLVLAIFGTTAAVCLLYNKLFITSLSLIGGLVNAAISEIIQRPEFTSGRTSSFGDVAMDLLGYLVGFLLTVIVASIISSFIAKHERKHSSSDE